MPRQQRTKDLEVLLPTYLHDGISYKEIAAKHHVAVGTVYQVAKELAKKMGIPYKVLLYRPKQHYFRTAKNEEEEQLNTIQMLEEVKQLDDHILSLIGRIDSALKD